MDFERAGWTKETTDVIEGTELQVTARWGARPEDMTGVAATLDRFITAVHDVTGWDAAPLEPGPEVSLQDADALRTWVASTVFRDDSGTAYPADGASPDLVFAGAEGEVLATIHAGRAAGGSRVAANRVDLTLRGGARPFADALLDVVVETWDPDFASIVDDAVMLATRVPGRSVRLGYRTVIAARLVHALPTPTGFVLDRTAGRYDLRLTGPWDADRVAAAAAELPAAGVDQLAQEVGV